MNQKQNRMLQLFVLIALVLAMTLIMSSCSNAHVHSFGEWTITKLPSCTEAGEQERLCTCGEKQTQTIPAKGHQFGEWKTVKNATCTESGEQERYCECGEKQVQAVSPKGHSFGEWKIVKNASCTESGEQERYCNCGERQNQSVSAKGHSFGDWSVEKEATCTADGLKKRTCSTCGLTESQTIAATGHKWKEATCTEPKQCTICGLAEGTELGHAGNPGQKCSRCGETINIIIRLPKLPVETWYYNDNKTSVESITYDINQSGKIHFEFTIKKTYEKSGFEYNGFQFRLLSSDGIVLKAGHLSKSGLNVGDKAIITLNVYISDLNLSPNTTEIILQIQDYSH